MATNRVGVLVCFERLSYPLSYTSVELIRSDTTNIQKIIIVQIFKEKKLRDYNTCKHWQ